MPKAALVASKSSLPYIRRASEALMRQIQDVYGQDSFFVSCDRLDDLPEDFADIVFIIGEGLRVVDRIKARRIVFINFSVVCLVGGLSGFSLDGWRLLKRKRKLLDEKLPFVDAILDYYPAQTKILQRKLNKPVFGFLPCTTTEDQYSDWKSFDLCDRPFDVSFVGGGSPRRRKIIDRLKSKGVTFGPSSGRDIEDLASQARITLNLRMHRSGHLEIPRIAGGLAAGSIVVSEDAPGLAEVFGERNIIVSKYNGLVSSVISLLENKALQEEMCIRTRSWYRQVYIPRAEALLRHSLEGIRDM